MMIFFLQREDKICNKYNIQKVMIDNDLMNVRFLFIIIFLIAIFLNWFLRQFTQTRVNHLFLPLLYEVLSSSLRVFLLLSSLLSFSYQKKKPNPQEKSKSTINISFYFNPKMFWRRQKAKKKNKKERENKMGEGAVPEKIVVSNEPVTQM